MAIPIDYAAARALLEQVFTQAESRHQSDDQHEADPVIAQVMRSRTQAYREVMIGCCLARLLDPDIDIRRPYVNQGAQAYNGRTLDEAVVNPFLQDHEIPSSRGPFLSVFRRSVTFTPDTAAGLRDRAGFEAMLAFLDRLAMAGPDDAHACLRDLLLGFIQLREASNITLLRPQRLSLDQYRRLIAGLLAVPSGGRIPVLIAVAMFQALRQSFGLDWVIEWQGINVADRASDVAGDITILSHDILLLAVEVTERPIDRARLEATFRSKILPRHVADYMFLHGAAPPAEDARLLAERYFAQGHDIAFLDLRDWTYQGLATVGAAGRQAFLTAFLGLLDQRDVPASIRLAWNDQLRRLLTA